MTTKEEYLKYINNGWKEISYSKFYKYLKQYNKIEDAIFHIENPKKRDNWRTGFTKVDNPEEVASYAKINSVLKASRYYNLSERQVYRYINKYK